MTSFCTITLRGLLNASRKMAFYKDVKFTEADIKTAYAQNATKRKKKETSQPKTIQGVSSKYSKEEIFKCYIELQFTYRLCFGFGSVVFVCKVKRTLHVSLKMPILYSRDKYALTLKYSFCDSNIHSYSLVTVLYILHESNSHARSDDVSNPYRLSFEINLINYL